VKHVARKRFGQHFLTDGSVLGAIVQTISPKADEHMLEIGPGLAALTERLLDYLPVLSAIEIDRDLARGLRQRFGDKLDLVEADVLKVDLKALPVFGFPNKARIVGNLPYNISSPLLIHLLDVRDRVVDQHFMLQKEVVDRLVAEPGTSDYGRLTVVMQCFYAMENVLFVPPTAFDPPPRVDSAIVRMIPLREALVKDFPSLEKMLAIAFGQRRKMLRGTLIPWLAQQGIHEHGLLPTARPEDVAVQEYARLARTLASKL
jgi:16S rRNA (adenine1518-N6/adenine1519-N6)-dimethyltransferase